MFQDSVLWFMLGILTCLLSGAALWAVYLLRKTKTQWKKMCKILEENGALSMRVSLLEEVLKEKEGK